MWDSLWHNVNIATCHHGQFTIIQHAALAISNHQIIWIGKENNLPESARAKENHDGENKWILPGFIDCHTHLIYAGNRANEFSLRLQGKTYSEII
jgi:imidazolonepropionase